MPCSVLEPVQAVLPAFLGSQRLTRQSSDPNADKRLIQDVKAKTQAQQKCKTQAPQVGLGAAAPDSRQVGPGAVACPESPPAGAAPGGEL